MAEEKAVTESNVTEKTEVEEITIKFAKGLVGEPFTSKAGAELVSVKIPNADENDKSSWASFVIGANQVHDNQFGKGVWAKIPKNGNTTIRKPYIKGQDENGKNIWADEKRTVTNEELKEMVEFYKTKNRDSALGELAENKKKVAEAGCGFKPECYSGKEDLPFR